MSKTKTFGVRKNGERLFVDAPQPASVGIRSQATPSPMAEFLRKQQGRLANALPTNTRSSLGGTSRAQSTESASHLSSSATDQDGPIRVWIVAATGFGQDGHRVTGLELLWRKLRKLSRPDVCVVTPQRWDSDAQAMADYIERNSAPGARVFFTGYSYGVGNYFKGFAEALKDYDIEIDTAVFCDGVRRFTALKILSMSWFHDFVTISVPTNVETVYAFYQLEDRLLRGHLVVAEDPEQTEVHMIEQHGFDHSSIDESLSYHRVAIKEAEDVIASVCGYGAIRPEMEGAL
ncbi:hypothetical protein ACWPKS_15875 [Coraliomargarita sp. W4R72]